MSGNRKLKKTNGKSYVLIPDLSNPPWPEGQKVLERHVRKAVKVTLGICGFQVWDTEQGYRAKKCPNCDKPLPNAKGGTRVTKGLPDLYAQHPGRKIRAWFETKGHHTKHGESPEQERFGEYEVSAGGIYVPGGWDSVARALVGMGLARR